MMKSQEREKAQAQECAPKPDASMKNLFYTLQSLGDQERYPDVVTGMLQVFSINVYELLNLGATLSFLTLLVSIKFFMLPDILDETFLFSTPVDDSVVVKRVPGVVSFHFPIESH